MWISKVHFHLKSIMHSKGLEALERLSDQMARRSWHGSWGCCT